MSNPTTPTDSLGRAALSDGTATRRLPSLPQLPERAVTPTQSSPVSYKRSGDGFLMPEPKRSRTLEASTKETPISPTSPQPKRGNTTEASATQKAADAARELQFYIGRVQAYINSMKEEGGDRRAAAAKIQSVVSCWRMVMGYVLEGPEWKWTETELKLLNFPIPISEQETEVQAVMLKAANDAYDSLSMSLKLKLSLGSPSEFGKPGPDGWEKGQRETSGSLRLDGGYRRVKPVLPVD
ncbi:uncharacterized protein LAESUDRAFT_749455 [Laetiporus sulphureus 93-53]|uniref:Uncharacterized protein n=1 Tax=Laetiporus sulphureus 93-53 TaxID=1314785 RepID=A0A165EPK3_9APHY|nr:uncharacterized protein LAESUDRAFT_749455 [Laetiporus sulphureus 93-53]KZT07498.1 hypothetical protein LAESUDRAFT_749455 [Laetiporus sulphureus 93-53]